VSDATNDRPEITDQQGASDSSEYTEQHYLPAASAYRERAADQGATGMQVVNWQRAIE